MTGFVYAIECGDAVKIGFAKDPVKRLSQLNIGHPGKHRLLGFASGTRDNEKELHWLCRAERIRGEWFIKGRVVSLFIEHLPPLKSGVKPAGGKLAEYIKLHFGTQASFAEKVGATQPTISRICDGTSVPSYHLARKIVEATNGEIGIADFERSRKGAA